MDQEEPQSRSLSEIHQSLAAAADGTPSTVLDAFVPDPLAAAGFTLQPLTIQTWLLLEKIKSPFTSGSVGAEPTFEQMMEAFYVLVMPTPDVSAVVRMGSEAFQTAVEIFAASIPLRNLSAISEAIAKHIAAEFAPRADMERPGEEGGGGGEGDDSPLPDSLSAATAPAAS